MWNAISLVQDLNSYRRVQFPTITITPRAHRIGYRRWFTKETIIWRLQVQSWLKASNNTGILNPCTRLWLMESEQATPVDSIKDVVWSSVCGTIASRHLICRWFRDYHMCRLVFLCFFPRPRCFQIRGKRRWLRSSRWRLEFVLERWKSCQANLKNDENKAFVINSNKRLFTQLFR